MVLRLSTPLGRGHVRFDLSKGAPMTGIDDWLVLLRVALDEAVRTGLRSRRDWVTLASPAAGDGAEEGQAMIVLTLAGVRPAPAAHAPPRAPAEGAPAGGAGASAAPLLVEADLLGSVRTGGPRLHVEALRLLSRAMLWLHANPSLGAGHGHDFGAHGHRLAIELAALEPDRLAALAAALGAGGRPCALYRLRGMALWEEEFLAPAIEAL